MLPSDIIHKHLRHRPKYRKVFIKKVKTCPSFEWVRAEGALTTQTDLHGSHFSLPTSATLYAVQTQAAITATVHCRHRPDSTSSLPVRLLEGISSPHIPGSLLTSPSQVRQHEKSPLSPEDFVVQRSQCVCMAAPFFALRESLSHAQTAGSPSDLRDTTQSLLCLAFWFLIDTFTARRR